MLDSIQLLIVDDDPINRELLEIMLGDAAILHMAENGREALEIVVSSPEIDLVLLDLEMPVMNGYVMLETLKKNPQLRDIPAIVVTANRNEVTKVLALGANDFLAKPIDPEELRLRVMNHVRTKKLSDLSADLNSVLEKEVARKTAALQQALLFSRETEYEISLRLGRAAEFRDLETGMHTRRISEMSKVLGELAGLSADECEVLRFAAPLHDVGKVGIPDKILLKPGKLDDEEFKVMKLHTVIGGKILADSKHYPVLDAGRIIAREHHEKWDGTGYPDGLRGDVIHYYARIVMIVDVFDALASTRPYKPAFTLERTLQILREGRGSFFDPQLLDLFMTQVDRFVGIREELCDSSVTAPMMEFSQFT